MYRVVIHIRLYRASTYIQNISQWSRAVSDFLVEPQVDTLFYFTPAHPFTSSRCINLPHADTPLHLMMTHHFTSSRRIIIPHTNIPFMSSRHTILSHADTIFYLSCLHTIQLHATRAVRRPYSVGSGAPVNFGQRRSSKHRRLSLPLGIYVKLLTPVGLRVQL